MILWYCVQKLKRRQIHTWYFMFTPVQTRHNQVRRHCVVQNRVFLFQVPTRGGDLQVSPACPKKLASHVKVARPRK